jgi:hypothetical protein
MAIAVVATLLIDGMGNWGLIASASRSARRSASPRRAR